jgi:hypothetical protein
VCRLGTPIVSGYVGEVTVLGKDERKILRIVTIERIDQSLYRN